MVFEFFYNFLSYSIEGQNGNYKAKMEIKEPKWKLQGQNGNLKAKMEIIRPKWKLEGQNGN